MTLKAGEESKLQVLKPVVPLEQRLKTQNEATQPLKQ